MTCFTVTPAHAGAPLLYQRCEGSGVPAFAGMTVGVPSRVKELAA